MKKIKALSVIDRLERLVAMFGGPYESERREFNNLVALLRNGPMKSPNFRYKLAEIEQLAIEGFSTRKFAKYAGGLMQLRVWALGNLDTVRSLIEEEWD